MKLIVLVKEFTRYIRIAKIDATSIAGIAWTSRIAGIAWITDIAKVAHMLIDDHVMV
jgi:hypothetical protein